MHKNGNKADDVNRGQNAQNKNQKGENDCLIK